MHRRRSPCEPRRQPTNWRVTAAGLRDDPKGVKISLIRRCQWINHAGQLRSRRARSKNLITRRSYSFGRALMPPTCPLPGTS
jgi:hypothetical protein